MAAATLAKEAGVSRQTIYAIESGTYVPNTLVALRLARLLSSSVEELFPLEECPTETEETVQLVGVQSPVQSGQPVRVCTVGGSTLAFAQSPQGPWLPDSNARVRSVKGARAKVNVFGDNKPSSLVLAGCDPAASVLVREMDRKGIGVMAWHTNSADALKLLQEGKVHLAGCHAERAAQDGQTADHPLNLFGNKNFTSIRFATWELGWLVPQGNPKGIRSILDLERPDITLANREQGSGTRRFLDKLIRQSGMDERQVKGYEQIYKGHIAVAQAVAGREADCGLSLAAPARLFGLQFLPVANEHYDLVLHRDSIALKATEALVDMLTRNAFRRLLHDSSDYETGETGKRIEQPF
jgi:putative molybdopterin biosynthesis protein